MKATLVREPPQVSTGNLRSKLQPGAAWQAGWGGHLQPTALHAPHIDFTMLLLFLTSGF